MAHVQIRRGRHRSARAGARVSLHVRAIGPLPAHDLSLAKDCKRARLYFVLFFLFHVVLLVFHFDVCARSAMFYFLPIQTDLVCVCVRLAVAREAVLGARDDHGERERAHVRAAGGRRAAAAGGAHAGAPLGTQVCSAHAGIGILHHRTHALRDTAAGGR